MADMSFRSFLTLARTKPANEEYNYNDPDNCPLAQWAHSMEAWYAETPGSFEVYALGSTFNGDQWTWGALVKRLELAIAQGFH